jgi:probable HAF family extracellular repeat protein
VIDLGTLPGSGYSEALDINDRGLIVGHAVTATGEMHAVLWTDGGIADLGTLPGDDFSEALAVNNRGQVVGRSANIAASTERAFRWEDGVMYDLGPLPAATFSRGLDVSDPGQIVGVVGGATMRPRAALIGNGVFTLLPGATDDTASFAHAINVRGDIAGYIGSSAVLWVRGR